MRCKPPRHSRDKLFSQGKGKWQLLYFSSPGQPSMPSGCHILGLSWSEYEFHHPQGLPRELVNQTRIITSIQYILSWKCFMTDMGISSSNPFSLSGKWRYNTSTLFHGMIQNNIQENSETWLKLVGGNTEHGTHISPVSGLINPVLTYWAELYCVVTLSVPVKRNAKWI